MSVSLIDNIHQSFVLLFFIRMQSFQTALIESFLK